MKKIFAFCFSLLCISNILFGQNIYKKYSPNDTIRGERLILGVNNLSYEKRVSTYKYFSANLDANYFKWKFTSKQQIYFNAMTRYAYKDFKPESFPSTDSKTTDIYADIYGGISYYIKPNKFYFNTSAKIIYQGRNGDETENTGNGYLFGGLGYGRIYNAQGLEAAEYLSEALYKSGTIKNPLDKNSLYSIDKIIRAYRNGNYENDYKDDAEVYLMRDVEKTLLNNNVINGKLDAETTMRVYTIITNSSFKYFYYPRYSGFQTQTDIQYHAFGSIKPKENFGKLTAIYGIPISQSTNLMLTGFYAQALNDNSGMYMQNTLNYYLLSYSDKNNFNFSNDYYIYNRILTNKSVIGFNADFMQSLSSTAGIFFRTAYYNYPKNSDSETDFLVYSDLFLQYNILSKLTSQLGLSYFKSKSDNDESYRLSLSFNYSVF